MSTQTQARDDTKQQEAQIRSSKDDVKQQSALKKKESKKQQQSKEDVPVDSGSSLVGGTIAAVQHAVDAGMNMLPVSVQKEATLLQNRAAELAKPITDSYSNDGLIAAAKTAGGIGAGAVSAQATGLKDRIMPSSSSSKAKASVASDKTKTSATDAADADPVDAPKKRTRRRRGGRGHGKIKMRALPVRAEESIVDTLGDKARELKEVVIEAPVKKTNNTNPGIVASARNTASQLMTNATNAASGIMSSASSAASGMVSGASSAASGMVSGAQQQIENLKGNNKEAASKKDVSKKEVSKKESNTKASKPALERHDELPALGTPMTPADGIQKDASKPKLAATPSDQSTLLEKASFLVGQARDYVADKLDDMSMNADDTEPLEEEGAPESQSSVMDKAKIKLEEMADSVSAKVDQATGSAKKQTKQTKKQTNKPAAEEEKEVESFQPKERID